MSSTRIHLSNVPSRNAAATSSPFSTIRRTSARTGLRGRVQLSKISRRKSRSVSKLTTCTYTRENQCLHETRVTQSNTLGAHFDRSQSTTTSTTSSSHQWRNFGLPACDFPAQRTVPVLATLRPVQSHRHCDLHALAVPICSKTQTKWRSAKKTVSLAMKGASSRRNSAQIHRFDFIHQPCQVSEKVLKVRCVSKVIRRRFVERYG